MLIMIVLQDTCTEHISFDMLYRYQKYPMERFRISMEHKDFSQEILTGSHLPSPKDILFGKVDTSFDFDPQ